METSPPRPLPHYNERKTIGELLGPLDQSRLHRVRRYVFPMLDEALPALHAPCIRAWLQPCRWRQSLQGFSPCCLPPCQVRETIGELLGRSEERRVGKECR